MSGWKRGGEHSQQRNESLCQRLLKQGVAFSLQASVRECGELSALLMERRKHVSGKIIGRTGIGGLTMDGVPRDVVMIARVTQSQEVVKLNHTQRQ